MQVIYSILAVGAFYLFNWISKSIAYSYVDETWTLQEILKLEWYLAGFIAAAICVASEALINKTNDDNNPFVQGLLIGLASMAAPHINMSIGLVVLYNVIIVSCIVSAVCRAEYSQRRYS